MKKLTWIFLVFALSVAGCSAPTPEPTEPAPAAAPEPPAKPAGPTLGIDVSHFQGDINWDEITAAGIQYAYSKATQGIDYQDPDFQQNIAGARTAKLNAGAYHFYVAGDDPLAQAKNFVAAVKQLQPGDMPPVLDLEQGGMKPGINTATFQKNVLAWLTHVEQALGIKPLIYTNHPFGNEYLTDPAFAQYHLWIAEYGVSEPKIPTVWAGKWVMWQRAQQGTIEGAVGNVDHDILHPEMSIDDLVRQ